jgi:hypothetical protein
MKPPEELTRLLAQWDAALVRDQMSLDDAIGMQFRLVDVAQRTLGSDIVFVEDYGQARELATVAFGGGGRPTATARVEEVLARFFDAEDAVLVQGAGTAAIRAMLNAAAEPSTRVLVHDAHLYKTTLPAMRHMALDVAAVDFSDQAGLVRSLRGQPAATVYLQHVPQQLGDRHDLAATIALVRSVTGRGSAILVDDNYAAMRRPRIGVQLGADASALSLFKLLAPAPIGVVLASAELTARIRADLSSAGCQVQGPDAMAALRSLVLAPVALAVQDAAVAASAAAINEMVQHDDLPFVSRAFAAQPGIRCVVVVFDRPVAEPFLRSAWRNGSPSRSVGEEAQLEFLPLFTYLTGTFLKATPGLERWAVRINPLRGGPETVLRILQAAVGDHRFQHEAASACSTEAERG